MSHTSCSISSRTRRSAGGTPSSEFDRSVRWSPAWHNPRCGQQAQRTRPRGSAMQTPASGPNEGLAREAIGLREVLFQSITHMAPAAAVAFSIVGGIAFAGGSTSLAVVIAIVACLLVAISIGQLAKHLPSAGALFYVVAPLPPPAVRVLRP